MDSDNVLIEAGRGTLQETEHEEAAHLAEEAAEMAVEVAAILNAPESHSAEDEPRLHDFYAQELLQ